ncbi:MAG: class I SAM-dependent methyltransferase [Cellulosilyticaceae bacterium]
MSKIASFYKEKVFPKVLSVINTSKIGEVRERILRGAKGKCLEISAGEGLSFKYYPKEIKELYVIEPNKGMHERCMREAEKNNIKVHLVEEMKAFEDQSFDTVVSQFVLCSINHKDVEDILYEVKRILKPGGRLIFVEHGKAVDKREQQLQDCINGIFKIVAVGCHINREHTETLQKIGFKEIHVTKYKVKGMIPLTNTLYEGYVLK